jgi:hypothetical protein
MMAGVEALKQASDAGLTRNQMIKYVKNKMAEYQWTNTTTTGG